MSNKEIITTIIDQLLTKRGIDKEEREIFLQPRFERDIHDPFEMKGMKLAVERLKRAIDSKEKITIFGDYDADGIPATAIMIRGLQQLGIEAVPIIPTRNAGYGLTAEAVRQIIEAKTELLVTVDNGTVSVAEIEELKAQGIDTIVCDHHQPQEGHIAEAALAILNPKQADCSYPFKELCGAGIAWKLLWALFQFLGRDTASLKWSLDLVALATVADMVPLRGENRVLVHFGLTVLQKTRNNGLKALALQSGVALEKINTSDLGFRFGPRLNAPSRMHKELVDGKNVSLQLLLATDESEAVRQASYLGKCNTERQQLLDQHLLEADMQAAEQAETLCLVLYSPSWSSGVIGLMAGRMVEKYRRPTIVLAMEEGVIKGSVRSLDGVDTLELLTALDAHLSRYGGHAKAGGLTLRESGSKGISSLCQTATTWLESKGITLEKLQQAGEKEADMELPLEAVTMDLVTALESLEPFGMEFNQPRFEIVCRLTSPKLVGKEGKHLSCFLQDEQAQCKAIGFGLGAFTVEANKRYRVIGSLQAEEWQGKRSVSCLLERLILLD